MKTMLTLTLAALLSTAALTVLAAEPSVARGKELFNDPNLGGSTNPMSCNTCHQDGKGMEKAGGREDLASMINTCIIQALQGKQLDEQSPEMQSLQLYIRSVGK